MSLAKARRIFLLSLCMTLPWAAVTWGQRRGGPPRRVEKPRTIQLAGGSVVEFRGFSSPSIGKQANYSIYLPPSYKGDADRRFPVVYFLHGMANDHTSWTVDRYGNVPLLVENLLTQGDIPQFVMVHPDGDNSLYTDFADGSMKYEQYIYRDLIAEIEANFRVKTGHRNRSIAGTSMGGYGALKIAMKHPQVYGSVAVGSPIILLGDNPSALIESTRRGARFFSRLFTPAFGTPFDKDHWQKNSVEVLARTGTLRGLNIYFAYGTADRYNDALPLEDSIRAVHNILAERDIPHVFQVYDGEPHGWALVRNHMHEMLKFLTQTF